MRKKLLFLIAIVVVMTMKVFAEGQPTKGLVVDENGNPLPGVSVTVKGKTIGTVTGIDGKFELIVPSETTILNFSFVGYTPQEQDAKGKTEVQIKLLPDSKEIGEVVVTALGMKRETKALGYTAQKLSGEDIMKSKSANIVNALSGKLAGVNITSANQLDGGSTRIVIRGNNSITGNNQPLFIIDGIPLENNISVSKSNTSENVSVNKDFGSGINFINSEDVEEMNVLKGPAAAALYGARGANGVILITTKKGSKKEGIGIEYSFTTKVTSAYMFRDQQNTYGFGGPAYPMWTANTEYKKNSSGVYIYPTNTWGDSRYDAIYGRLPSGQMTYDVFSWHAYSGSWGMKMQGQDILYEGIGVTRKFNPQPDNQKYYYKNGITNTHNVSFSNAGDFGSVRIALNRVDQTAVVDNSDYNKTTASLGANMNISKSLKAEVSLSYDDYFRHNISDIGNSNQSYSKFVYLFPVDYDPALDKAYYKKADGSRNDYNKYPWADGASKYIFWNLYENSTDMQRNQTLGSLKLTYTPLTWLNVSIRQSLDYNNVDIVTKNRPTDVDGFQGKYEHSLKKKQ